VTDLIEYEEDVLMDAAGYAVEGVIPGAAYNVCAARLVKLRLLKRNEPGVTPSGEKLAKEIFQRRFGIEPWLGKAAKAYNARYVGLYDLPNREGPFYVFYTENPDRSKGHDNYFGLVWRDENPLDPNTKSHLYILSAATIRDAVFSAFEYAPGKFICSRYRHNYVMAPNGHAFLDGGLAYVRGSVLPTHTMKVIDGREVFTSVSAGAKAAS